MGAHCPDVGPPRAGAALAAGRVTRPRVPGWAALDCAGLPALGAKSAGAGCERTERVRFLALGAAGRLTRPRRDQLSAAGRAGPTFAVFAVLFRLFPDHAWVSKSGTPGSPIQVAKRWASAGSNRSIRTRIQPGAAAFHRTMRMKSNWLSSPMAWALVRES